MIGSYYDHHKGGLLTCFNLYPSLIVIRIYRVAQIFVLTGFNQFLQFVSGDARSYLSQLRR